AEVPLALHRLYLTHPPLAFVVQPRILDRDRRVRREQYRDRLVLHVELLRSDLLGQVEITKRLAAAADRASEERPHRGVMRREPVALRVPVDVGGADRPRLADHETQQTAAPGQVADPFALDLGEAGGDELAQRRAVRREHPERRVARTHTLACSVTDLMCTPLQRMLGEDRHAGREQALEAAPHPPPFTGALPA